MYSSFVRCVSDVKHISILSKNNRSIKLQIFCFASSALAPIFHFKLCSFYGGGAKIFSPQRRVYPSYATDRYTICQAPIKLCSKPLRYVKSVELRLRIFVKTFAHRAR